MAFENGFALVIGIGSYINMPYADIPISVADAEMVKKLLCDPKLCGYLPEKVIFLHDENANRTNILDTLSTIADKVGQNDTVLIYYCGHGDYGTDGNYYLTTYDTEISNGKILKETGIRDIDLLNKLKDIPSKRLVLLLNSCHSGEISPNLDTANDTSESFGDKVLPMSIKSAILSTGEGRIIITACRPEQKSWIGNGKLSIFTKSLVDGLSGKGFVSNNSGYISIFSLYEHMYFSIKDAVEKFGKIQEPELTILKGVGPFPIALYHGADDLGTFDFEEHLPTDTATHEIEDSRSERLFSKLVRGINVTASGKQSVSMQGKFSNTTVITGNKNTIK